MRPSALQLKKTIAELTSLMQREARALRTLSLEDIAHLTKRKQSLLSSFDELTRSLDDSERTSVELNAELDLLRRSALENTQRLKALSEGATRAQQKLQALKERDFRAGAYTPTGEARRLGLNNAVDSKA